MNPFKLVGLALVILGVVFRAISLAYFNMRAKSLPDDPRTRRRFFTKKRNALLIDALFIAGGFYVIIRGL